MVVKDRRTKILLSLFLLATETSGVDFDEKLQKIFDLSLNQKTRGTLSGLMKEGLIEKSSEINIKATGDTAGRAPDSVQRSEPWREGKLGQAPSQLNRYKLTNKGFLTLCLSFPFFRFLKEKWDGRWRIISYEIPESRREIRDRLRREMQGWGLGPWHRSFWLTPHPIIDNLRDLVSNREEEKYIQAFEAAHVFGGLEILIEKVWAKSLLDKKYRQLFKTWHDTLSQEGEKISRFKKVLDSYLNLLKEDPGLPKELIGDKWIGFESFEIFKEIRSILLS